MLNSAAGVTLPSAIAPPISTIRSMSAATSGWWASSSAMLVSGPVGISVTGPAVLAQAVGEEVDRVQRLGLARGRRQVRPVEPRLAVHVRGHARLAHERPVGPGRHRHVAAAGELEHPQRVGRRLVERLVAVHGRDPEQLQLGARERQQQRHRVVVPGVAVDQDRRRHDAGD